jgi:hypothetical protein
MLYNVQDTYGGATLMIVAADAPIGALDAFAVREGFPPYSALDDVSEYTYTDDAGRLGAVFTNHEIVAVPVALPVRPLGVGQAGYGIVDAAGVTLVDAADSPKAALAEVAVELVLDALPADPTAPETLELVEAADRALAAGLGDAYIGSVPEGRDFVADGLEDNAVVTDRRELAEYLVDNLTAE